MDFVQEVFKVAGFSSETNLFAWKQARERQEESEREETRTKNIIYIYLYIRMPIIFF